MVLCPPHSEQTSGVDLDPFPDLGPGPADPFPDLQPSQDGPAPLPNPGIGTAARAEVSTRLTWPRPVVKRMRVVMVAALTVVAVASGATGPYPWSPGGPGGHPDPPSLAAQHRDGRNSPSLAVGRYASDCAARDSTPGI